MEPPETPEPKSLALKDRIADLRLGQRASETGGRLAERMKALQAAAPGAADLKAKLKAAAQVAGQAKLSRDGLKAGRDSLAAKVEGWLKPRRADDTPRPDVALKPEETTPPTRDLSIAAMKARLDQALKSRAETPDGVIGARTPIEPSPGAPPTSRWTNRFARAKTQTAPAGDTKIETTRERTQTASTTTLVRARRPLFSIGMLLTALVSGAVLHILTTFAVPVIGTVSAFDRLKWQLELNAMRVLPADPTGATPAPFLSPDMRYAMCRYDLTNGSVQVSAVLPDLGWSLALYTPQGDNFYTVPGQDGRVIESVFNINSASDRVLIPVPGVRRSDTDAANVTSPQREGLVVVRAPNTGTAYAIGVEAALRRATCQSVGRR